MFVGFIAGMSVGDLVSKLTGGQSGPPSLQPQSAGGVMLCAGIMLFSLALVAAGGFIAYRLSGKPEGWRFLEAGAKAWAWMIGIAMAGGFVVGLVFTFTL